MDKLKTKLENLVNTVSGNIKTVTTLNELNPLKSNILGKKGLIATEFSKLREHEKSERKDLGILLNNFRNRFEKIFREKNSELNNLLNKSKNERITIDVSLPGINANVGHLHPITQIFDDIISIFQSLGFQIADGPDIENEYYNFKALNFPDNHPARDMQDTMYLTDGNLLRTHTSPVQIRVMERTKPPFKILIPGRVFRCDSDISHSPMFHQVEGLMVGETVSFPELKGSLISFCHTMFGSGTGVRFRPSFFPFTEPSAEIDIECIFCKGKGCRVCKNSGWIEILGAGMVDPNIYKFVNYDSNSISGFAFGIGVERIAMLKYQIDDIRLFFRNEIDFLEQF